MSFSFSTFASCVRFKMPRSCAPLFIAEMMPSFCVCPYMSAFDMLYKLATHYFLYNNAFAFLQKDERGRLVGVFPLPVHAAASCSGVIFTVLAAFHLKKPQKTC